MSEPGNSADYSRPQEVDQVTFAFPANLGPLLPPMDVIPDEFTDWNSRNPYVKWQGKWFYSGLTPDEVPEAKEGIDKKAALRHLATIQGSFEPKHEHKVAAVAWLASLWLEEPNV